MSMLLLFYKHITMPARLTKTGVYLICILRMFGRTRS